jgi:acyl-CoA reductase-like NAD-dependent aldehyde dehydrogenase
MRIAELMSRWRAEAATLRSNFDERAARLLEKHADDLAEAIAAELDEPLDVQAAAAEAGVHPETIKRAVRSGQVENVGTPGRVRVRRRDLPRRPGRGASFAELAREAVASRGQG